MQLKTGWKWASLSTYYDSQSGMHVPVHHDNEVSAILSTDDWSQENMDTLANIGLLGIVGPNHHLSSSDRSQSPLDACRNENFSSLEFFLRTSSQAVIDVDVDIPKNVTLLFPYDENATEEISTQISTCVEQSIAATAIVCQDKEGEDSMLIANGVAQILDDTGGGKYVFVVGTRGKYANDILELCEELSYLDLAGPTMKSRLVVDLSANTNEECEDAAEECLMMGVNKFVIDEDRLNWLGHFVQNQGKSITFRID